MFKQGEQANITATGDSPEQGEHAIPWLQRHLIVEDIGDGPATQQEINQLLEQTRDSVHSSFSDH